MLKRIFAALTIAAFGLSLPYLAEAAPGAGSVANLQVSLDDGCTATITWEPLQGGKPIFAHVVFQYGSDTDGYTTFLDEGANEFHKVKQNAGTFELDFASIAATQPTAESYQVQVHFVDRKDDSMSDMMVVTSGCIGV